MNPYPVESRVLVGDDWGRIVKVMSNAPPVYRVSFDPKGELTRSVAHTEILFGFYEGIPLCVETVDADLFLQFVAAYCTADTQNGQQATLKQANAATGIPVPNPVLWDDRYWLCLSDAYDCVNNRYAFAELRQVVPLAEYKGEIRAPQFLDRSKRGYRVTSDLGDFVMINVFRAVAPETPVNLCHDDDQPASISAEPKSKMRRVRKSVSSPEPSIEQLTFDLK